MSVPLPADDDLTPDADLARTPAARRVLDAAGELFYRRGIHVVGVDLVADRAGTTKKTLYDRFGSKDGLVAAYLTHRAHRWRAFLRAALAKTPDTPETARTADEAPALVVFDALAAWLAVEDRGCGFVNAYAELGGADHGPGVVPALEVVRAEKRWMRALFAATLAGPESGDDPGDADADAPGFAPDRHGAPASPTEGLATQLHVLYEGATVLATVSPGSGAVAAARAAATALLARG